MKFPLNFTLILILTSFIVENIAQEVLKCENKGCYEVIKAFTELLTTKISESDALLATAERELNKLTSGSENNNFKEKIKEVDEKLETLILELTNRVNRMNKILTDFDKIENLLEGIETETESSHTNINASNNKFEDLKELIREIQSEMNRVMNLTEVEGPTSLQDALDHSSDLDSNTGELKSILAEAKHIIFDYEINLMNAKTLTSQALKTFGEVDRKIHETKFKHEELNEQMEQISDLKVTESELKNTKKLARESLEESNKVFDESFEMHNEVSRFELEDKRVEEVNDNVEKIKNFSIKTMKKLQSFLNDNSETLKEIRDTMEKTEKVEKKAVKVRKEVDETLDEMKTLHAESLKSISNKDHIIRDSQEILSKLNNFDLKIEYARENARRSMEKIDTVIKRLDEALKVLSKVEHKLEEKSKFAFKRRDDNVNAKQIMENVIEISAKINLELPKLENVVDDQIEEGLKNDKDATLLANILEALEGQDIEDIKLIKDTKENVERTKQKRKETDRSIDETIKLLENTLIEVATMRTYDEIDLDDFERQVNEAEKLYEESQIEQKIRDFKAKRQSQNFLMENYKQQIAELEYQLSVIRKNAESLQIENKKCFRRIGLEP